MKCKICQSENLSEIQYKVFKCNDCLHTYINYTGDGLKYHKEIYRSNKNEGTRGDGEVDSNGIFTKKFHERRRNICNSRISKIETYINESNSLLDIGAGGGTFVNMLSGKLSDIEVTEIGDVCVSNLKLQGYKVYSGNFADTQFNRQYDLVTCWHVLEHIQDLKPFVDNMVRVTKKYLVIEVPINRAFRNPDKNFDGHFHYFSRQSLIELFKDSFEPIYMGDGVQMPCLLAIFKRK